MGGKEFGAETKGGIAKQDIDPTLEYVARIAKIPKEDLIALGSAGKKTRSGDIDVAIDSRHYAPEDYERIVDRLRKALGDGHSLYRPGFDTHAFAVPIAGDPRNGRVQIDLKYNDASFLRFSHFSAEGERTQYKGAVRSFLLASLAASLYKEGQDVRYSEGGKVVVDVRWGLDVNAGLKRIYRMCKMRRDGAGRKKDLENVSPKEIRAEFPDLEFDGRQRTITNPSRIVTRLFGPGVKPKDVETPEAIVALLKKHHPELVKSGFLERVGKSLDRMGLVGPPELGQTPVIPPVLPRDELSTARLPKLDREWRELRIEKGKKTKVWAISIEPDGESFRVREGTLGGKIHEYNAVRPGPKGRPGSSTYTSAEDACKREVERRVQLRLKSGYGEIVDGELTKPAVTGIDFDKPFPRNVRTPKPEQFISDKEFRRLHEAGLARITRKYDGMGLIVVHHNYGWEAYSLQGNRVTDLFPRHIEELAASRLPPGTVLKAEAIIFSRTDPQREDFGLMNGNFSPSRKPEEVRRLVENGSLPEPAFVFYDCLFHGGEELGKATYDERSKHWRKFPVAKADNGILLSAELYKEITPDNWRKVREELGFEGFVVVDGSSTLGDKAISFSSSPPRPKGSYKLKPNMEEDVVIYAVRMVDGVYESVFTKQRFPDRYPGSDKEHSKAGEWFYCGRVSIAGTRDVLEKIDELVREGKIEVVECNKDGERIDIDNDYGVTAVVEFFDRYASNKFRHPKFAKPVRFRDDGADYKAPSECVAHYLGEIAPKAGGDPERQVGSDDGARAHA